MSSNSIVLVEDDLNLRNSIALILQRAGYFVTTTDCVSKAMDIIKAGNYQLVIADINMAETRKILLPNILMMKPRIAIVILTDQSIPEIEKSDKLHRTHYLAKPIAPERLLDCVGTILGKQTASRRNIDSLLLTDRNGSNQ